MANKDRDNEKYNILTNELCDKYPQYPYLQGFVCSLISAKNSRRTIYYYTVHVIDFLDKTKKPVEEITLDDYNIYIVKFEKRSSSYLIVKYSAINKFAKYMFVTNRIPKNFMEYANRPKYIEKQEQVQKREKGYLTPSEIQIVISNIEHSIKNGKAVWYQDDYRARDMALVLMLLTTGMRTIALQNLDVDDLNLEEGIVTVTDKEDKVNVHQMPENTITVLKKWLIKRQALLEEAGKEDETALFISNRKNRMSYATIKQVVEKYCSTITGKNITPHKLRATYGTMLYNKTHDIEFVRKQMHHSNIATTQRYIRGNDKDDRQKAADIMGDIISNRRETENLFEDTGNEN